MDDDIELREIEIINGGLIQVDLYNISRDEHYIILFEPEKFFKKLGDTMKIINTFVEKWNVEHLDKSI